MAEEKGILDTHFDVQFKGMKHWMNVEQIIELIENAPQHEQEHIKNTFSQIDFSNGDLIHYIKFLAEAFLKHQYKVH